MISQRDLFSTGAVVEKQRKARQISDNQLYKKRKIYFMQHTNKKLIYLNKKKEHWVNVFSQMKLYKL